MKSYNGHRSWNAWNVALHIGDKEPLYRFAIDCLKATNNNASRAATRFLKYYRGERTPDGARYNHLSVKLAMESFIE